MPPKAHNMALRHSLQRMQSPDRGMSALFHTLGLVSFGLSYKYLFDFPSFINESYGWHFQYLTILGLTVATLTFIVGLLADFTLSPTLFIVKNTLSLCSAPLEVLISALYWGISAIDKKLLVPPEIQIAPWADVGFHAMPSILLTIDLLFLSPPWTIRAAPAMALSLAIAIGYWAWVEHCYSHNGLYVTPPLTRLNVLLTQNSYPYPLFEQLDTVQRIVLFTGAAGLMTGSTVVLQSVYKLLNGVEQKEIRKSTRNIKRE